MEMLIQASKLIVEGFAYRFELGLQLFRCFLAVLAGLYALALKHTAALMENRKEKLIGTLQEKLA